MTQRIAFPVEVGSEGTVSISASLSKGDNMMWPTSGGFGFQDRSSEPWSVSSEIGDRELRFSFKSEEFSLAAEYQNKGESVEAKVEATFNDFSIRASSGPTGNEVYLEFKPSFP